MKQNTVMISGHDLSISYGRRRVIDHADFNISLGVTGLVGANGSGKTTLLNVLATMGSPQTGTICVNGLNIADKQGRTKIRSMMGYLPQTFDVIRGATVLDNVAYAAWAHGVAEDDMPTMVHHALKNVDLLDVANVKAKTLSGGQRQRLGFACATAHRPKVLLLDEPTVALDESHRRQMNHVISVMGRESAIVMSSHLVEELGSFADNIMMLMNGRLYSGESGVIDNVQQCESDSVNSEDKVLL